MVRGLCISNMHIAMRNRIIRKRITHHRITNNITNRIAKCTIEVHFEPHCNCRATRIAIFTAILIATYLVTPPCNCINRRIARGLTAITRF